MNTMIAMIPILPPAIPITVQPAPHTHTTHTQCPSLSRPLSRSPLTAIASRKQNEKEPAHHAGEGGGGRKELLCLLKRTPQSTPQNGTARAHACARALSLAPSLFSLPLTHSLALPLFRLLAYVAPSQSLSRSRSRRHTPPPDPRLRLPPERGLSEYAKPCPPPLPFPCPWHSSSASDGFMHTLPAACA